MITEIGHKYTPTESIILEEVEPTSGDVVELYYECDRDIGSGEAVLVILNVTKIKETYPNSVIHYVGIDARRITVQYSVAPPGGEATPMHWYYIAMIIAGLIALIIFGIYLLHRAGLLPWGPAKGDVSVIAINAYDGAAIAAPFTFNGDEYTTPITIGRVSVGTHHITWLPVEGYLLPDPPMHTVTVIEDKTVEDVGNYWADGPRPDTGLLVVDTYPVRGTIYVDEVDCGKGPLELTIEKGDHRVAFGDVSGYEGPQAVDFTMDAGGRKAISAEYKRVWPTWTWAVIGVAGAAAIAAIATAVRAIARR